MKLTSFLLITAIVEIAAGLALLIAPAVAVALVFGVDASEPTPLFLARWLGVALLAIGVAGALARDDPVASSGRGVTIAAVLYDVAVALLFVVMAVGSRLAGPVLWPAVGLHAILAVWGLLCLADRASVGVRRGRAR
jgi:hypothetical protein